MFQFPGFPYAYYVFICVYRRITNGEFPHSDICGSLLICSSPQLFAACHVLLRRLVPRHPPYALLRLIVVFAFIFLSQFFELLKNFVSVFFPQQKYHICAFCVLLFDIFFFFVFSFFLKKLYAVVKVRFLSALSLRIPYTLKEQKRICKRMKRVVLHLYSRRYR